ncbi:hypothetical protein [Chryseobacterium tongliaoense]|uniref:hypothetical protein n=1 Tax=Chryseobacterium tongliaoense TaxID=3240933 RepID=UPI0035135291
MNNDQYQNKYDEVFRNLKEEKMDWDFEDFLKKAEGKEGDGETDHEAPVIPIGKNKPSFPKWFWMAASVVVLLGIGLIFNYNQDNTAKNQAQFVENQIKNQKNDFIEENNDHEDQVAVNHTNDTISGAKKDSIFQENTVADKDVLDEILPKRGRLKKERKPKYVDNSSYKKISRDSTSYNDSYVIVNGKRITSEKEAIDVATYSFMKMGSEFKKSVASSQKNENLNNEY